MLIAAAAALSACADRPSVDDYSDYESMLRAHGKLRTDTVAADAPYDADDLARNFVRVALAHEVDATRPGGNDNLKPSPLRRWHGPLRYRFMGSAVTAQDRREVDRLMRQIARLTGLDTAEAEAERANFLILITEPEERDRIAERLARLNPHLAHAFAFWREHREVICVADNLFLADNPHRIGAGVAVIGAETTGLLRQACLHEEIVQALGLANDHPAVRPSIFNDDGEFALLTEHDAQLLSMLYDERLRPGMQAKQALPVARRVARELMAAEGAERMATARR